MKEEKKSTTRKKKTPTTERSKKDPRRLANGNFAPKNTIGEETRFDEFRGPENSPFVPGNTLSTKYKDEYADLLIRYYNDPEEMYPTLEGFAMLVGVHIRSIEEWASGRAEYALRFSQNYAHARAIQRKRLIEGGLSRRFDPSFARFLASAVHGMSEKQTVDNTVKIVIDTSSEIDEESN
jgi:hypothetical protein